MMLMVDVLGGETIQTNSTQYEDLRDVNATQEIEIVTRTQEQLLDKEDSVQGLDGLRELTFNNLCQRRLLLDDDLSVSGNGRQLTWGHQYYDSCTYCGGCQPCAKVTNVRNYEFIRNVGTEIIDLTIFFEMPASNCNSKMVYYFYDNGSFIDSRIFTTQQNDPGRLYVNTNGLQNSDKLTWTLLVKAVNGCNSGLYDSAYFNVNFNGGGAGGSNGSGGGGGNVCDNPILEVPEWQHDALTIPMFQYHNLFFYKPETLPDKCGRFTYELVFSDSRELFYPDIYTFKDGVYGDRMYFQGTIDDYGPIVFNSPHSVTVKAYFEDIAIIYSEPMILTIENPCIDTVIEPQIIFKMTIDLGSSEPAIQFLPFFQDTISLLYTDGYGNGSGNDICGPQQISLVEEIDAGTGYIITPAYAYVDVVQEGFNIVVQSQNLADVGTHNMILSVNLSKYGIQIQNRFEIDFLACIVTDISVTHPANLRIEYNVGDPAHVENLPEVFLTPPDCGQLVTYSLYNQITGLTEPWAILNAQSMVFFIETNDVLDVGTYYILLLIDTDGVSNASPVQVVYQVIIGACNNGEVIVNGQINDITYRTSQGPVQIFSVFDSTIQGCQLALSYDVFEQSGQSYNPAIFTFDQSTGKLVFDTNNVNYIDFTFRVTMYAEIQESASSANIVFFISVVDGCTSLIIEPPSPINFPPFSFDLFVPSIYDFTYATFNPPNINQESWYNCGMFKYTLVDSLTATPISDQAFRLSESSPSKLKFFGQAPSRNPWLTNSPFEYKIRVTLGSYLTIFSDPFVVNVNESCDNTELIQDQFATQFASLFSLVIFDFDEIKDTLSQQYSSSFGDGTGYDLCGARQYLLFEQVGNNFIVPTVARLSSSVSTQIEIEPTNQSQIGVHKMILEVALQDYAPTLSIPFNIVVQGCQITFLSIDQPATNLYSYDIVTPATLLEIPIPSYTVEPDNCPGGFTQGLNFVIGQDRPNPVVTPDEQVLSLSTDDINDFGTLLVILKLEPSDPSPAPSVEVLYTIQLSRCKLDAIQTTTIISDFDYVLGQGPFQIGPNLANSFDECPVTYELTQNGQPNGDFNNQVFSFDEQIGILVIDDNGIQGLESSKFALTLKGTLDEASQQASESQTFTVTFVSRCQNVVLTPPAFQEQPPVNAKLWAESDIFFNLPQATPSDCATFTYKLYEDISGNEIDPQLFSINDQVSIPFVRFTLPGRDPWLINSPFILTLEAEYGEFGTTESDSIEVTVLDTCFETTLTPQNIVQLTTYINAPTVTTRTFNIFTDVVADTYSDQYGDGTGYDLCGPQTYVIKEIIENQVVLSDLVTVNSVNRVLSLQSDDVADTGLHDMLLCITLSDYQIEYCQPFAALVSDCEITNLQLNPVSPPGNSIIYKIQTDAPITNVPLPFAQYTPSECVYDLIYNAFIFNSNQSPLPSFLSFNSQSGFKVQSGNPNDVGTYQIELTGQINGPSKVGEVDLIYTFTLDRCLLDTVSQTNEISDIQYIIGTGPLQVPTNIINQFAECDITFEFYDQNGQPVDPLIFTINEQDRVIIIDTDDTSTNGQSFDVVLISEDEAGTRIFNYFEISLEDKCASAVISSPQFFTSSASQDLFVEKSYFFTLPSLSEPCGDFLYELLDFKTGQPLQPAIFVIDTVTQAQPFVKGIIPSREPYLAQSPLQLQLKTTVQFSPVETLSNPFSITVVDPCFNTNLISSGGLNAMSTTVNAPQAIFQTFQAFGDSVSEGYSDDFGDGSGKDLCGLQSYELFERRSDGQLYPPRNWISLDTTQKRIVVQPDENVDMGSYDMILRVTLPAYGKTLDELFEVFFDDCVIVGLNVVTPSTVDFMYDILNPATTLIIPRPTATVQPPQCAFHGIVYSWNVIGSNGLPSFATSVPNGLQIKTSQADFADTYTIELIVEPNGPNTVDPEIFEYELIITACRVNEVQVSEPQPDLTYYIGTGALEIPDGFLSDQSPCSITYSLIEEGKSSYDTTLFTFESTSPIITINTADISLNLKETTLILKAVSDLSGQFAQQLFTVTFIDGCRDVILDPAQFNDVTGTARLYESKKFFFTESAADLSNCGTITYKLIDKLTNQELVAPEFVISFNENIPFIEINALTPEFAQNTYEVVLESSLGTYATAESDPILITINDPCLNTVLISQNIPQLFTEFGDSLPATYTVPLFQDSVSVELGDGLGVGLCGAQTYELFELVNGSRRTVNFAFLTFQNGQAIINVQSDDLADIGQHQMVLDVQLAQYNIQLSQQFSVQVREDDGCSITALELSPGQDLSINYEIRDPAQPLIKPFPNLIVTPSTCLQTYSYEIVLAGTSDQPSFASTSGNGIQILAGDPGDIATYDLELIVIPNGANQLASDLVVPYSVKIQGCIFDTISVGVPIGNIVYQLSNGAVTKSGDFVNEFASDCPFANEYSLQQVGYTGQGTYDQSIFTFSSQSPTVTIDTQDVNLLGQVLTLELTATATQTSGESTTDTFAIAFTDGCTGVNLEPVQILTSSPASVSLYEPLTIEFNPATTSLPGCGTLTYEVIDLNTNAPLIINTKDFNTVVSPATLTLLSTSKAQALTLNDISIRATQGNLASVDSDDFKVDILDPCVSTDIENLIFPSVIETSVKKTDQDVTYNFGEMRDSVSLQYSAQYGDGTGYDICGPREYQIFEIINNNFVLVDFATLNEVTPGNWQISVQTDDPQDIGLHNMALRVNLLDYIVLENQLFDIQIDSCELLSISPSSTLPDQAYIIGDGDLVVNLPAYIQMPDCDIPLTTSFTVTPDTLPDGIINKDPTDPLKLTVGTDDLNLIGSYEIAITATVGSISDSSLTFDLMLQPNVEGCENDQISVSVNPILILYEIGEPAQAINAAVTQSVTNVNCPVQCFLTQDLNSLGNYDTNLFSLDCDTYTVTIFTENNNYDLKTTSLTLQVTSLISQSPQKSDSAQFVVETKNICRSIPLNAAEWLQTFVKFDFRNTNRNLIGFQRANFENSAYCDSFGITYSLVDLLGQPISDSFYTIFDNEPPEVRISAPEGQYFFQIKAETFFTSSISTPIEVVVADLCLETQFTIQQTLIELDSITIQGPSVTQAFDRPETELAIMMDIQYICGDVKYELIKVSGPAGSFSPSINSNVPSISAQSTNPSQVGGYEFILRSQSTFYPQLFIDRDVLVSVDQCIVTLFEFAEAFDDIEYIVGSQPVERTLQKFIIQPNCDYNVEYQANLVTSGNNIEDLPNGFEFFQDGNGNLVFTVETASQSDEGEYVIQIQGSLDDGPQQGTASTFRFTVIVLPDNVQPENTAPIFLTDLPPQIVTKAGKSDFTLDLQIPNIFDAEGDSVSLDFDFAKLSGWLIYDSIQKKVLPDRSSNLDFDNIPTGNTDVTITLTDDNPQPLRSIYSLLITVNEKKDPVDPVGPVDPVDPVDPVNPVNLQEPSEGIISDITNTGDVVINLEFGINISELLRLFENSQRRRELLGFDDQDPHYTKQLSKGKRLSKRARILQAVDAAIDAVDLITVELIPSPESDPSDLSFTWELISSEDEEIRVKLTFDDPEKVSSKIDNDQIKITIRDPKMITDPKAKDIKAPTIIIQDIVRQVDLNKPGISELIETTQIFQIGWVVIGGLSFFYFIILTGGKEDPFLWSFLETMQLLTHIQLINVKIPGNAALFLNLNNQLFRYDFFPNEWVAELLNLELLPSPVPVWIQIRYLQVHMLMNTIFICGSVFLMTILMVAIPLIRRCAPKTADGLAKRLFWGVPIRMIFEFYFILALTSWNNMNNPGNDVSKFTSMFVLAVLFGFTLYIYYYFALAFNVKGENQRHVNKDVQQMLQFIQRPLRLRRYKPIKFLYPVYYLTRRMILAMICVYLSDTYATQWLVWTLLSLGMLFIIAKIRPFGDSSMNVVQFINELFIFVALVLLMPLCNNLTNLSHRDNVGWCIYSVVLACIIFNILILLLRSCSIMCEYIKKRNELIGTIRNTNPGDQIEEDPEVSVDNPFPRVEADTEERTKVYPIARDFQTFGRAQAVSNSLTSLQATIEYNEFTGSFVDSAENLKGKPISNDKPINNDPKKESSDEIKPSKWEPINKVPKTEERSIEPSPEPWIDHADYDPPREVYQMKAIKNFDDLAPGQKVSSIPQDISERYLAEPDMLNPVAEHNAGTGGIEEIQQIDDWKQLPEMDQWDLYPLKEGIQKDEEPLVMQGWDDIDEPKNMIHMVEFIYNHYHDSQQLTKLDQNDNQKGSSRRLVVDKKFTEATTQKDHDHENDEDHECPICNAAKPKKPKIGDLVKNAVEQSVVIQSSLESGFQGMNESVTRTQFEQNQSLYMPMAQTAYGGSDAGDNKTAYNGQGQSFISGLPQVDTTSNFQDAARKNAAIQRQKTFGVSEYPESLGNTESMISNQNIGGLQFDKNTGVVHRQEEQKTTRIIKTQQNVNDSMRSSNDRFQEDELMDMSNDISTNAWERHKQIGAGNNGMEMLDDCEGNESGSIMDQQQDSISSANNFGGQYLDANNDVESSIDANIVVESQHSLGLATYIQPTVDDTPSGRFGGPDANPMESIEQVRDQRYDVGRFRRVQREVNTQAEQMQAEDINPRESEQMLNLPPHMSRDSLFRQP